MNLMSKKCTHTLKIDQLVLKFSKNVSFSSFQCSHDASSKCNGLEFRFKIRCFKNLLAKKCAILV